MWPFHDDGRLTATANATVSRNRIDEYTDDATGVTYQDVEPLLTPRATANASLTYALGRALTGSLDGRFVGQSYLANTSDDRFTTPGRATLDASVGWSLARYTLGIRATNLTSTTVLHRRLHRRNGVVLLRTSAAQLVRDAAREVLMRMAAAAPPKKAACEHGAGVERGARAHVEAPPLAGDRARADARSTVLPGSCCPSTSKFLIDDVIGKQQLAKLLMPLALAVGARDDRSGDRRRSRSRRS